MLPSLPINEPEATEESKKYKILFIVIFVLEIPVPLSFTATVGWGVGLNGVGASVLIFKMSVKGPTISGVKVISTPTVSPDGISMPPQGIGVFNSK